MGDRIEIKPNDQSWVGKKVIRDDCVQDGRYCLVKFVGSTFVLGENRFGVEGTWAINDGSWQLYTEPKKKRMMAPAIYKERDGGRCITSSLYDSLGNAKVAWGKDVIWPAVPNADGFYEVEESPEVRP